MTSTVVIGNPRPQSRTRDAALRLHRRLWDTEPDHLIELSALAPALVGLDDGVAASAVESLSQAGTAVIACPTYKGAYTGLLKLFLDRFPTDTGLKGVVAVPLMLGASLAHSMAADLLLKPVLVELGATTPSPGLFLVDSTYTTDGTIDAYAERWGGVLHAAVSGGST
jgi:FMN reductase